MSSFYKTGLLVIKITPDKNATNQSNTGVQNVGVQNFEPLLTYWKITSA